MCVVITPARTNICTHYHRGAIHQTKGRTHCICNTTCAYSDSLHTHRHTHPLSLGWEGKKDRLEDVCRPNTVRSVMQNRISGGRSDKNRTSYLRKRGEISGWTPPLLALGSDHSHHTEISLGEVNKENH